MARILSDAAALGEHAVDLHGVAITGGRLELGYPTREGERNRHLGGSIAAIREVRRSGLVPFFELPMPARSQPTRGEAACWTVMANGHDVSLQALVANAMRADSAWLTVPAAYTGIGLRVLALPARVTDAKHSEKVTLVQTFDARSSRNLFVTTLDTVTDRSLRQIGQLAASELDRQTTEHPVELAFNSLLEDWHLQKNRRRRLPERRSYAGLAQAAFALARLAEAA